MSGKTSRQVRKGLNALRKDRQDTADELVRELLNAPLKYRVRFAVRLVFRRRAHGKVDA